jgi:hypothetical protein
VPLVAEEFHWNLRVSRESERFFDGSLVVRIQAMVARLPESRYLKLHATWKDGAREALYAWLHRHWLGRLARWAARRWPVKWITHDAALLFPAVSLPEHLRRGMTHQIHFLDQQLPVFTGRRSTESRT